MVAMKNLKRTGADVAAEKKALGAKRKGKNETATGDVPSVYVPPEDEGARMEFEHHHLEKMGVGGDLKSGDELHFHGHGTVERSETKSSPDGDRHSATVRFHKGSIEHTPLNQERDSYEHKDLREQIEKVHGAVQSKIDTPQRGAKVAEKADGKG